MMYRPSGLKNNGTSGFFETGQVPNFVDGCTKELKIVAGFYKLANHSLFVRDTEYQAWWTENWMELFQTTAAD